ncbi:MULTISPECIES: WXG100 family type VII secretion target [unclassified Streptomyces]|uniref:WXG100 family type VII secretion target n=1 Tax=Streptomyces sp. DK15 TaxID=2957499 RepID=UPI0029B752D9|nr:WXG100 family type VII secretion target [Streptomyces sp. DK15]MDX2392838.1 WXG100 family type VII secretion target [Streptomyces sp. DK15]
MATDFEGHTHEQLLAMIASIDPGTVTVRAAQLSNAAKAIEEIGESLKRHRVRGWDGEAADAFQDWVSRAGNATLRLAEYGAEAGRWLTEAAQTMIEVKANTPPYDTAAAANLRSAHEHHNDPDAREAARTAHSTLDADHERAIQQLTKLAQSYEASATQLTRAQLPTFPPPPGAFEPERISEDVPRRRSSSGVEGWSGSSAPSHAAFGVGIAPPASQPEWSPAIRLQHEEPAYSPATGPLSAAHSVLDRDVQVRLDHVAVLPDGTAPPPAGAPGGVAAAGPSVGGSTFPLPSLIPTAGAGSPIPGLDRPPNTRSSVNAGPVTYPGGRTSLPPPDNGIVGGRPTPPRGPTAGLPRGTVIGTEAPSPMGRGMGGGTMGGAVTGRPPSAAGSHPFTQGGSGLVRNGMGPGGVGGVMGPAGAGAGASASRRDGQRGSRPDHLVEDEETWQGNRRVVPPVID